MSVSEVGLCLCVDIVRRLERRAFPPCVRPAFVEVGFLLRSLLPSRLLIFSILSVFLRLSSLSGSTVVVVLRVPWYEVFGVLRIVCFTCYVTVRECMHSI